MTVDPYLPLSTYDRCMAMTTHLASQQEGRVADLVFGRVPHPKFLDRIIPDDSNVAWRALGKRTVKGVVYHRMLGSLSGTEQYFSTLPPDGICPPGGDPTFRYGGCNGLTDYGVSRTTGEIRRWNDPAGFPHSGVSANRSPHASGPYSQANAYGDGRAFVEAHGGDTSVVNRDQASIEIDGNYGDPVSPACVEAVAGLTAYWADQARVPWESFPIVPGTDYSFVRWHDEFCGTAYKPCPGPVVKAYTDAMIARAKEIMRGWQTQAEPAPAPTPPPPKPTTTPAPTTTAAPAHDPGWFPGMDLGIATWLFGDVELRPNVFAPFDPSPAGSISREWFAHGRATGVWGAPAADVGRVRFFDAREYLPLRSGLVLWRANNKEPFRPLRPA